MRRGDTAFFRGDHQVFEQSGRGDGDVGEVPGLDRGPGKEGWY